jgi:hypothetical protein
VFNWQWLISSAERERVSKSIAKQKPHLIRSHSHVFGACSFLGISKLKAPRVTNMPHKNPQKRSMVGTITWETKKGKAKAFTYNDFEV